MTMRKRISNLLIAIGMWFVRIGFIIEVHDTKKHITYKIKSNK